MTTRETLIEQLTLNVGKARGLWIGMSADRSPQHELIKLEVLSANDGVSSPDDHVTIAHLGKTCGRREVESAVAACDVVSALFAPVQTSVECLGRFWSAIVAIVAPRKIDEVADTLDGALRDRHVYRDESFAGIRHVTVMKPRYDPLVTTSVVPKIKSYTLTFRSLMVVCGDARFETPFSKRTELVF